MKKAFLITGVIVLVGLAFVAGRFSPRGQFFSAGGPPLINGEIDQSFIGRDFSGESFFGEVVAFDSSSLTVRGDEGEMVFQIDPNTRFSNFGTLSGLQSGDVVDVQYETLDGQATVLSVTVTNYLPQ